MTRKPLAVLAWVALLIGGPLRSQQSGQPDPLFKLGQQSRVQVEEILDSARSAGLPNRLLRSKALEGIMKGANDAQVLHEVKLLFGDLKQARAALGSGDSAAVEAGADALYAGVIKPEDLAHFKPSANGRSPVVALTYLSDLIQYRGVAREDAIPAFVELWRKGAADADFKGLWQGVDQDILSGVNPNTALQNRVRQIPGRGRGTENSLSPAADAR